MNARQLLVGGVVSIALGGGAYALLRDRSTLPDDATAMIAVSVPPLGAVEQAGAAQFDAHCAQCHGRNGAGVEGVGPPLVHVIYEPAHHADGAFYAAVQLGVRAHHWEFGDMPRQPHVAERDITRIIAYIRALQRANGID